MALNFKQELTAVFGFPVAENPTQAMVEAAYRHHGLDWRYLTIEVKPEGLADAVTGAGVMGFRGFNLTIPHKVSVMPLLDGIGESASLIGAVNCVVTREGKLIGENTDGRGFLESLRPVRDPAGLRAVILGAGGAARAVAVELLLAGVAGITVINRSAARGEELVGHLRTRLGAAAEFLPWSDRIGLPAGTDLLIQATSIGLYPDVDGCAPLDFSTLSSETVVADVIPNPPLTPLLKRAAERGCPTIDGLGMLINQGRIGIQYWTGVEPDASVMRLALEQVFTSDN